MGCTVNAVWSAPLLFAFRKVLYINLLQMKYHFSSSSLWLRGLVWVSFCQKPPRQVLSWWGPYIGTCTTTINAIINIIIIIIISSSSSSSSSSNSHFDFHIDCCAIIRFLFSKYWLGCSYTTCEWPEFYVNKDNNFPKNWDPDQT